MYQVNFSEQSMKELNQLKITKQMEIAEIISSITKDQLAQSLFQLEQSGVFCQIKLFQDYLSRPGLSVEKQ